MAAAAPGIAVRAVAPVGSPVALADVNYGLGGSASFPGQSVFRLQPGETLPEKQSLQIQNIGDETAEVRFESTTPPGITVTPDRQSGSLAPGQREVFPFSVSAEESAGGGEYEVIVSVVQTDVPSPKRGGSYFAPGFSGKFTVVVGGPSGSVSIAAVDANDGHALRGELTLAMAVREGTPIVIDRVQGTELSRSVAPGRYVAGFEVPGLTRVSQPVRVRADQNQDVTIEVETISFLVVGARPKGSESSPTAVELIADVSNAIQPVDGPVNVTVSVDRDGTPIEEVSLGQLPRLPVGTTSFARDYVPADGFGPGDYHFTFRLIAPEFEVTAADTPQLSVPASTLPFLLAAGALVVIALVAFVLIRRRNRRA